MSIQIEGYKITKKMTPKQLIEFSKELRQKAEKIRDGFLSLELTEEYYKTNDYIGFERVFLKSEKLRRSTYQIEKDYKEHLRKYRDTTSQHELEIVFYPITNEKYLMTFLCSPFVKNEYREILEDYDFIEDYSFWDNTDRPDGVSRYEWKKRRDTWEKVFEPTWTQTMQGFSITLINEYYPIVSFPNDKLLSKENRIHILAREIIHKDMKELIGKNADISTYLRFVKSDEYKDLKSDIKSMLEVYPEIFDYRSYYV